jgi:hypothetical protein
MLPDETVPNYRRSLMVVYGDSNWSIQNARHMHPSTPMNFGMAYDLLTGDVQRFKVVAGEASIRWCKAFDFRA